MSPVALCPLPRRVQWTEGACPARSLAWRLSPQAAADAALSCALDALEVEHSVSAALAGHCVAAGVAPPAAAPARDEAYALAIAQQGFTLTGSDPRGLYWGLMTLRQMLGETDALSCCSVEDWPAIAIRGHFDDISRKQISTLDDFRRIVRLLARYKINTYCLYIEDTLHLRSYPDIGEGRGKLMPTEVAAIVEEGRLHHVEVMPAFQLFGHYENILAMPNYRHLAREVFQSPSSLDPRKPAVREFLSRCIAEVCALFPGQYFCIGFDETQGIDRATYLTHANWCAEQISAHGKKPVFWADMLYNHFGCDAIGQMHPALIPANWNYGVTHAEVPHQAELEAHGRPVWAFAGYSNWSCFAPDFEAAKDHLDTWAGRLADRPGSALLCTQWGDDGYENSRDLCWNLFAYLAEQCWSGPAAQRSDFEDRFQATFYGGRLAAVQEVVTRLAAGLSQRPGWYWRMHRKNVSALFRHALAQPQWRQGLERDQELLQRALRELDAQRSAAQREAAHLDHFAVALERVLLVVERLLLAFRHVAAPAGDGCQAQAQRMAVRVREVRDNYARVWLRHNKRENMEVSMRVFDEAAAGYERLVREACPALRREQFVPLDLAGHWDKCFLDVAGLPIGPEVVKGVPFCFADLGHTHVEIPPASALTLSFDAVSVRDIVLVATVPKPKDEKPAQALRVQLLRHGAPVFTEVLSSITHLIDWWAPLGEHMWAGGGLRHADQPRVLYLCRPDAYYGLVAMRAFPIATPVEADTLVLTPTGTAAVQLFAVTLERTAG